MSGEGATNYNIFGGGAPTRLSAGSITRSNDGVIVGTYVGGRKNAINSDFLKSVSRIVAQKCGQLPNNQRELKFTESTCSKEVNFHFGMDPEGRVYLIVVDKAYPSRTAFAAIDDFKSEFVTKDYNGSKSMTCKDEGCKQTVQSIMTSLARRYEDVNTKDQVARVQSKVDNVREQMQMNICSALEGMDTTENILAKSEELKASAQVFKKNAAQVNKLMWWQKFKMQLIAVSAAVIVIAIIAAILAAYIKKH